MKARTISVLAVTAALFIPYVLLAAYYAHHDPGVYYLDDNGTGWMLNPEDKRTERGFPLDFPATYSTTFNVDGEPANGRLKLNAVSSYELKVNGVRLSTEEETSGRNWKNGDTYDLSEHLHPGVNDISVHVRSPYSVTALRAEGEVECSDGGSVSLSSGSGWTVVSDKTYPPLGYMGRPNPVEVLRHDSLSDRIRSGRYYGYVASAFGISAALLAAMLTFPGISSRLDRLVPAGLADNGTGRWLYRAGVAAVFVVLAVVLVHNAGSFDPAKGGDFPPHRQYLNHFLESWRVPTADEGFQMYNPPVYYMISAGLYETVGKHLGFEDVVECAQAVNSAAAFITVAVIFLMAGRFTEDRLTVFLGLCFAAFLPVSLYKAPSISGDSFNALLCTLSLYAFMRYAERPARTTLLAMSALVGVGFLTRYGMLFVILGIVAGFGYAIYRKAMDRKKAVIDLAIFSATVLAVSGWFYARNLRLFGRLFPVNGTKELFFYRQVPGYRDWDFYSNVYALFLNNPQTRDNVTESFLSGMYNTFWFDGQFIFIGQEPVLHAGPVILLALAVFPTVLLLRGLAGSAVPALGGGDPKRAMFSVTIASAFVLTFVAVVKLTYGYPMFSITKAHYLLPCIAPITMFFVMGVEGWTARRGRLVAAIWVMAVCAASAAMFWV